MEASKSNQGVKRKNKEKPTEIHKRIKLPFACPYCLREYTNHPYLTNHIIDFNKKTETVEKKDSTTYVTRLEDVIETTEFIRRSMVADLAITEAAKVDEVKLTKLRFGNFDEKNYQLKKPKENPNLQQKMASKWQEIIDDILDQEKEQEEEEKEFFEVVRAKQVRNTDIFDVYFSSNTEVFKIANIVQKHCEKNSNTGKFVTQPLHPATKIRLIILNTIGKKAFVDQSNYLIRIVNTIPHLVVKDKKYRTKCETEYTFSQTVLKYKQLMTTQDFTEAYEACKKSGFFGPSLHQFIVL